MDLITNKRMSGYSVPGRKSTMLKTRKVTMISVKSPLFSQTLLLLLKKRRLFPWFPFLPKFLYPLNPVNQDWLPWLENRSVFGILDWCFFSLLDKENGFDLSFIQSEIP